MSGVELCERRTAALSESDFRKLANSRVAWSLVERGIISFVNSKSAPFGVRAGAFVGQTLLETGEKLVIKEKSAGAFVDLLRVALPDEFVRIAAPSHGMEGSEALEVMAARLLDYVGRYLVAGRWRRYRQSCASTVSPRGRVDIARTLRGWTRGRRGQVTCWRPDLTADLQPNRLVRLGLLCAERVLAAAPNQAAMRQVARSYSQVFSDARGQVLSAAHPSLRSAFEHALVEASESEALSGSLAFSRALLFGLGVAGQKSGEDIPDTYFANLEAMFEDAVLKVLRHSHGARKGGSYQMGLFEDKRDLFVADPDFVMMVDGAPVLVGDCKYKVLSDSDLHSDVYQLVSHCTAFGCSRGMLVFPGDARVLRSLGVTRSNLEVFVLEVRTASLASDLAWAMGSLSVMPTRLSAIALEGHTALDVRGN